MSEYLVGGMTSDGGGIHSTTFSGMKQLEQPRNTINNNRHNRTIKKPKAFSMGYKPWKSKAFFPNKVFITRKPKTAGDEGEQKVNKTTKRKQSTSSSTTPPPLISSFKRKSSRFPFPMPHNVNPGRTFPKQSTWKSQSVDENYYYYYYCICTKKRDESQKTSLLWIQCVRAGWWSSSAAAVAEGVASYTKIVEIHSCQTKTAKNYYNIETYMDRWADEEKYIAATILERRTSENMWVYDLPKIIQLLVFN